MKSTPHAPDALKALPGWLIWKFEPNGNSKPRKVPYYAAGGRRSGVQGRDDDVSRLTTFAGAAAAAATRGFDGVGFAPLTQFGVTALDFDNCVDSQGRIHPDVINVLGASYAEFSPSGKGIRALFRGDLGDLKAHGEPFGFEVFSRKGFVTITGDVLPAVELVGNENTIAEVPPEVVALCKARFKRELTAQAMTTPNEQPLGLTQAQLGECLEVLPEDLDYDKWVQVGMAIHHETQGEGFELWDAWSQLSPKYTDRDYGIERWNSFGKGAGRVVTARTLVHLANENGARITLNGPASMEEFDEITAGDDGTGGGTREPTVAKKQRFPVIDAVDFAVLQPASWIIKNVLPRAELGVLYGEAGSGKSFMALDLAMAVARGSLWRGNKVTQGRVVHIVAEGAQGFRKRLIAYAMANELDLAEVPDYKVIAAAPNLLLKEDALEVARSIEHADLVIVDTWAQATPGGNENSGEDMGKALAHCKGIHRATKAMVLLIHHSGKDASKGARGWSGLRAAADTEFEVVRVGEARAMRASKQKDAEDDAIWGFTLDTVNVGLDEDDDVITSCVVVEATNVLPGAKLLRRLGEVEKIVNDVVQEMAQGQNTGIEVKAVVAEAVKRMPAPEGKRDTRKQRAGRALDALCSGDDAPYLMENDCISIV